MVLYSSLSLDSIMYYYSQFWFIDSELLELLDTSKEYHILVVGCFEGLSSVFFADHFLEHPNSTLTCIDPHNDSFDLNIHLCKNKDKITIVSCIGDKRFNFIYTDREVDKELLEKDGILWVD